MVGIRGVYEVAVKVRDLAAAERFYRDVLGFEIGLPDARRPWIFMRAGGGGMIVLQEESDVRQDFAFTVSEDDIDAAAVELRRRGIAVEGPVMHEWIQHRPEAGPSSRISFALPGFPFFQDAPRSLLILADQSVMLTLKLVVLA